MPFQCQTCHIASGTENAYSTLSKQGELLIIHYFNSFPRSSFTPSLSLSFNPHFILSLGDPCLSVRSFIHPFILPPLNHSFNPQFTLSGKKMPGVYLVGFLIRRGKISSLRGIFVTFSGPKFQIRHFSLTKFTI